MEVVGWIGSLMLAICAIPQAYESWRVGHANGLTWGLILLWGGGEVVTFVYVLPKGDWPLIVNYGVNIVAMGIITKYKWKPRHQPGPVQPDHFPYG